MTPERWEQVNRIVNDCLEMDRRNREAHLAEACASDPGLRSEVESLLASCEEAEGFMEVSGLDSEPSKLFAGQRVGDYELRELIGEGGMGAVYLAERISDFDRKVAIKLVKRGMDTDSVLRRFRRERQILAGLDHLNIARLLDGGATQDGRPYLVMEYVEGSPIDEYCDQQKLSVEGRLRLFIEVCEAVEYAHQKRVIHRDVKPSNILVTAAGVPKVLDFGIAKVLESATRTVSVTETSTRCMTPAYASPEQVRGRTVTPATDVYSLGVLLYKLLTRREPYRLTELTPSEIERAVCEQMPEAPSTAVSQAGSDMQGSQGSADLFSGSVALASGHERGPMSREKLRRRLRGDLDNIVLKALRKEPEQRYQSVQEFERDIERHLNRLPVTARPSSLGYRTSKFLQRHKTEASMAVIALLALAAATILTLKTLRVRDRVAVSVPAPRPARRIAMSLPPGDSFQDTICPAVATSVDGRSIAYIGIHNGGPQLYLWSADRFDVLSVGPMFCCPFFSPNGEWIGFFGDGKLKKMSIHSGGAVVLADAPINRGASWGPDAIIFSPNLATGLQKVSERGGPTETVTEPDPRKDERTHRWPQVLPGGKAVLFTIGDNHHLDDYFGAQIAVQRLDTGERKVLPVRGTYGRYVRSGHLLVMQERGLVAVPFDLKRLEVTGRPVVVANDVAFDPLIGGANFAVSDVGDLIYIPQSAMSKDLSLAWLDRQGKIERLPVPPRPYREPHLSPDGKQIAVTVGVQNPDIWVVDIPHGLLTRLTFDGAASEPVWAPDGRRIAYSSLKDRHWAILCKALGSTEEEETLVSPQSYFQFPVSFTPDGRFLTYVFGNPRAEGRLNINVAPLKGNDSPRSIVAGQSELMSGGQFSPDGHWLLYFSGEESGAPGVYVEPFGRPGGRVRVSTGGAGAVWSRNGREVFYEIGNQILSATVTTQPHFASSTPHPVVTFTPALGPNFLHNREFDVAPDGRRFLVVTSSRDNTAPDALHVVQGWLDELERTVRPGKE